jgi:hypothetical protein
MSNHKMMSKETKLAANPDELMATTVSIELVEQELERASGGLEYLKIKMTDIFVSSYQL